MKRLIILVITIGIILSAARPSSVSAHRSGCHRWHSCPSDTGSYVCGDLGYDSECPSYVTPNTPPYSAPVIETWEWRGDTYYYEELYRNQRREDIENLYYFWLGRGFHNQQEANLYVNSDKIYDEIEQEIMNSNEKKENEEETLRKLEEKAERIEAEEHQRKAGEETRIKEEEAKKAAVVQPLQPRTSIWQGIVDWFKSWFK